MWKGINLIKKTLVIFFSIFLILSLSSCQSESKDNWLIINDKLFSNFDTFAGCGLYFYEENSQEKVDMLIYGSGVRIAKSEVVNVNSVEQEKLFFTGQYFLPQYDQRLQSNNDLEILIIDDKTIKINDMIFTIDNNKELISAILQEK